jgi:hypothetical protein
MPVLHKYTEKSGYYILTAIGKKIIAFQLSNGVWTPMDVV